MSDHRQVRGESETGRIPRDLAAADDLSTRRLVHVNSTIEHRHRKVEDGARRLQRTGFQSPRAPLEFHPRQSRHARTMRARGDHNAIGSDALVPEPDADGAIALAVDAGDA